MGGKERNNGKSRLPIPVVEIVGMDNDQMMTPEQAEAVADGLKLAAEWARK